MNTQRVIKSDPEFLMKDSRTTLLDSSRLRVEVLLKTLLVEHKWAQKLYLAYDYEQVIIMQDIKRDRVER